MSTILTFVDYYLPGFKGGGPLRTIANIVEQLGDEHEFRIVTRDRDLCDEAAYAEIQVDAWQRVGKGHVFYASPSRMSWAHFRRMLTKTPHAALYLNSLFSPVFTFPIVLMRAVGAIPRRRLIVAPRGELSPGALAIRPARKRAYLAIARSLDLFGDVTWQASSEYEARDIRAAFPNAERRGGEIVIAPDLLPALDGIPLTNARREPKRSRELCVIFLSRLTRKKNVDGALRILAGFGERVQVDIYGPLEDEPYWAECLEQIAALPPNVSVSYRGSVAHEQVPAVMAAHDLFFFPTHGENFGHVIVEAMAAGCPVLITDQTAFRGLGPLGVGWDVAHDAVAEFQTRLREVWAMDETEHARMRRAAAAYAVRVRENPIVLEQNRALFARALDPGALGG
ncbi:MAG: glycosyltransferase family 4 protein [Gemmatimonadaceae bacterium]